MATIKTKTTPLPELLWLSQVREKIYPIGGQSPVWVRHGVNESGPTYLYPERHPFFEFGTNFSGVVTQFVKNEQTERRPGDVFFAGPGLPHYAKVLAYPHAYVTVYFLPSVLLGMGPLSDGARFLRRFTTRQHLDSYLVRPPPKLREELLEGFRTMIREFDGRSVGREMMLRSTLTAMIVSIIRWEEQAGRTAAMGELANDWRPLDRAMEYLHQHFREPVYAHELARHAGVCESRLKVLFHDALGIPWSRYLQSYRIYRSLDALGVAGQNIAGAALEVGFQSLSHFNAAFRSVMGTAPRDYLSKALPPDASKTAKASAKNGRGPSRPMP